MWFWKKVFIGTCILCLVACGSGTEDTQNTSQVAAKVNGKEITVHQINHVLKTVDPQSVPNDSSTSAVDRVLDQIINQEIIKQKALEMKLDRNPDILTAIEFAKQQVLIESYIKRIIGTESPPSDDEVASYFNSNPKLFNERKIFDFTRVLVKVSETQSQNLIETIRKSEELEDVMQEVEQKSFPHAITEDLVPSEKLPKLLLEPLYSLSEGDIGYLRINDGLLIIELHTVTPKPITLEAGRNAILQFLSQEKRNASVQKIMKDARSEAVIEYIDKFSPIED